MINVDIKFLADCPECIPELSQLWFDEIGKQWIPHSTNKAAEENFESHRNRVRLPLTLVAIHNGKPIGMCSLRQDDGIGDDLTPWLASLIVHPHYRGQGLGETLIEHVKQQAMTFGFDKLYLFALDANIPSWYERLGWKYIGLDKLYHHPVTVMGIELD